MVTIGHINAIHGLQNVPHSGEEDGPRGRMRDGRGIEEGREGVTHVLPGAARLGEM